MSIATDQDVLEALRTEAISRGFVKGCRFISAKGGNAISYEGKYSGDIGVSNKNITNFYLDGMCILDHNGNWATLREPEVIKRPIEINGYVMNLTTDNVQFGCYTLSKQSIINLYNSLVDFNIDIKSNTDVKTITVKGGVEISMRQLESVVDALKV